MTPKQFYDWQTAGGTDDVMRLVDLLERADVAWCAFDGIAVNHWADQPMVTRDVDLVVAPDAIDKTVSMSRPIPSYGNPCRMNWGSKSSARPEAGASPRVRGRRTAITSG